MSRRAGAFALAAVILALAGCDGGSVGEPLTTSAATTTTPEPPPTTPPEPPRREARDPLPDRPPGWRRFVNERGGYALFLPRGWNPKPEGPQTLIRSYDQLVALTIAADRSPAALGTPIINYATATAAQLRGFRGGFDAKGRRPLDHRYDAVQIYGSGRSRDGVEQRASVIVLRRGRLVTLTVVLAANATPAARESVRLARRAIATLRTRPPRRGEKD